MKYFEVTLQVKAEDLEELETHLAEVAENGWDVSESVTEKDLQAEQLHWSTIYDEDFSLSRKEEIAVKIYFEDEGKAESVAKNLESTGLCQVKQVNSLEDTDYANAWKKYYHVFSVGEITIVPVWEDIPETDNTVIRINPGMAFGSGTHESTMLCLEMLQEIKPEGFVYDVGCGSGILGISALLLGADQVHASDIDPLALQVAEENAELNGVEDRICITQGDLLRGQEQKATLIFGNLIAEVLLDLIPQAQKLLLPEGVLILSGILAKKEVMVTEALKKQGFDNIKRRQRKEWVALLARRS